MLSKYFFLYGIAITIVIVAVAFIFVKPIYINSIELRLVIENKQ